MLIRNLETNAWYKSVNYFDYKARPIQSFSQNHLGGIDSSYYQYRFNGEVLKMRTVHQGITEIYDYAYDHVGRKTSFKHTKNGVSQNVAKYEYDAIGRMKTKIFKPAGSAVGSKQTGNWTDVNTWLSGGLPTISDNVTINAGHTVTIPSGQNVSAGSLFDKGTLQNFGTLQMGNLNPNSGGSDFRPCWCSILRKSLSMPLCCIFHPQHVRQQHAKPATPKCGGLGVLYC